MPIELPQPESRAPAGAFDLPVSGESPTTFSSPRPPANANEPSPGPPKPSPLTIGMAVLSAAIVALLAMVVLYHRTSREAKFTNTIVVWGKDDSWDGATVHVMGDNLPGTGFEGKLSRKNDLACRFHVPEGRFSVVVQKDGRVLERIGKGPELREHLIWWPCSRPASLNQGAEK